MDMPTVSVAAPTKPSNKSVGIALFASCFGWALDLFDLYIVLYVAPYVAKAFFPSDNPVLGLAAVYASFAVTLCMRPIGSALFGNYADTKGRKGAMMVAMTGVGLSTASFGLLPGYEHIGLWAPGIYLVLRLVQGVFVGGVVASTHTIGTESVPKQWRGLVSGLIGGGGSGLGALLASLSFLVMSTLFPGPEFEVWGWRAMFLSGVLSAVFGLAIFLVLEESPMWANVKATGHKRDPNAPSPVRQLFSKTHRSTLLVNLLVTAGGGSAYYVTAGYLPTVLRAVKVDNHMASMILVVASVASIAAGIIFGQVAQWHGRRKAFLTIAALGIVCLPYCFMHIKEGTDVYTVGVYSVVIAFIGNALLAPIPIFLNERFPTAIRASGTGLSWNLGFAMGGTMPVFVTLLSPVLNSLSLTLSIFSVVFFLLYTAGAMASGETKNKNM